MSGGLVSDAARAAAGFLVSLQPISTDKPDWRACRVPSPAG